MENSTSMTIIFYVGEKIYIILRIQGGVYICKSIKWDKKMEQNKHSDVSLYQDM